MSEGERFTPMQLVEVQSRVDLAAFVAQLRTDLAANLERWANSDLDGYLEALGAWLQDADGWFANRGEPIPSTPSWSLLAQMLAAAAIYE